MHLWSVEGMLKPSSWMWMMHTGLPPRSSRSISSPWDLETLGCCLFRGTAGLWRNPWIRQSYSTGSSCQPSAPQQTTPQKGLSQSANPTETSMLPVLMRLRLQKRGMQTAVEPESSQRLWIQWHQPKGASTISRSTCPCTHSYLQFITQMKPG